jgi:hypothetical protein
MTKEQLSAIRERLDAATPGAWSVAFVTLTAPDLRALLDEVERLTAERDDLLAWAQRFSDLVGVDGSTEAGRDEAFAKLYDAAKAAGKLVRE